MSETKKLKLIIFDIDNTLTESRTLIDKENGELICQLLSLVKVAAISGESLKQFSVQIVDGIPCKDKFSNFYLLPTCGAELYEWKDSNWNKTYTTDFSEVKKQKVLDGISKILGITGVELLKYVEDKGPQLTYAGLGINAPLAEKNKWDVDHSKRIAFIEKIRPFVPGVQMSIGGTTSIDFTEEGMDKAFGVRKILSILNLAPEEALFIGDALYPGGNDYPVITVGVGTRLTAGPNDTKKIIKELIAIL